MSARCALNHVTQHFYRRIPVQSLPERADGFLICVKRRNRTAEPANSPDARVSVACKGMYR